MVCQIMRGHQIDSENTVCASERPECKIKHLTGCRDFVSGSISDSRRSNSILVPLRDCETVMHIIVSRRIRFFLKVGNVHTFFATHPPSFSNKGPTIFATWSICLSAYLAPTSVRPMGKSFSPLKPITLSAGAWRIVHIEQKDW
jgi:hypothetical protein